MLEKKRFFLDHVVSFVSRTVLVLPTLLLFFIGGLMAIALVRGDKCVLSELAGRRFSLENSIPTEVYVHGVVLSLCCFFLGGLCAYFVYEAWKFTKK
jgi:hypothetical protein